MELKEGIVIKSMPYQENAKIVSVITSTGKESMILKGAMQHNSRTFRFSQELTHLEFETKRHYFSGGRILNSFGSIKSDLKAMQSVIRIFEIVDHLTDHINDFSTFYSFLLQILTLLDRSVDAPLVEILFRVKTLYLLGVAPVFGKCVECESKTNLIGFALEQGGMICSNCVKIQNNLYSRLIMEPLILLYTTKMYEIDSLLSRVKINYQSCDLFLNQYYEQFLGFRSKTADIIEKL